MAAQSTYFSMTRDINGYNGFGLVPATDKQSMLLATSVAQSVTVPSNHQKWIAIFGIESGASVWVALNTTAVVPAGAASATSSELNPTAWQVSAGDTISFITADASAQVGVKFYVTNGLNL